MDPITHALIGALLAVLSGVHQRYGLAATAALVAASVAPDLDALSIILGPKYFYLYHRALFHSLGGALLLGLGFSVALYLFTPLKDYRLLLALSLGGIAGGTILVEYIFAYPGMGYIFYQSITNLDYTMIQGIAYMIILMTSLAVLIIDLVYPLIDPRITYQKK